MNEEPTTELTAEDIANLHEVLDSQVRLGHVMTITPTDVLSRLLRAAEACATATFAPADTDVTRAIVNGQTVVRDDARLADVMEGFRARHPNVSVFATATPGLREALERLPKATCYREHQYDFDKDKGVFGAVWIADVLRATATPGLDVERWRKASESLEVIDGIVDDSHAEGCGCPLCHELDNLREVLDAALPLSASGETEADR